MYDRGDVTQKKQAKEYFKKWAKRDKNAAKIYKEIITVKPLELKSEPLKLIEFKIEPQELKLVPLYKGNKKTKKRQIRKH